MNSASGSAEQPASRSAMKHCSGSAAQPTSQPPWEGKCDRERLWGKPGLYRQQWRETRNETRMNTTIDWKAMLGDARQNPRRGGRTPPQQKKADGPRMGWSRRMAFGAWNRWKEKAGDGSNGFCSACQTELGEQGKCTEHECKGKEDTYEIIWSTRFWKELMALDADGTTEGRYVKQALQLTNTRWVCRNCIWFNKDEGPACERCKYGKVYHPMTYPLCQEDSLYGIVHNGTESCWNIAATERLKAGGTERYEIKDEVAWVYLKKKHPDEAPPDKKLYDLVTKTQMEGCCWEVERRPQNGQPCAQPSEPPVTERKKKGIPELERYPSPSQPQDTPQDSGANVESSAAQPV